MKRNKRLKIITPNDTAGWMFVLPFVIGFIFLFAKPVAQSLMYSFNDVTVGQEGLVFEPIGWENFKTMLTGDAKFIKALWAMVKEAAV